MGATERQILQDVEAGQGLWYWGVVSEVVSPTQVSIAGLAGRRNGLFQGYAITVISKADGTTTPPKSEFRPVTAYAGTGGLFTHTAFTVGLAVGDEVVLLMGWAGTFGSVSDEVAINMTAVNTGETEVFNLPGPDVHYIVDKLRLKCEDPIANIVTVRLYELINAAPTQVDAFNITTMNFGAYLDLRDMFGVDRLVGDSLRMTLRASAGGPYIVLGSFCLRTD